MLDPRLERIWELDNAELGSFAYSTLDSFPLKNASYHKQIEAIVIELCRRLGISEPAYT